MSAIANFPAAVTRWRILGAAPHRPMFLIGAVQLVLVMLLWLAELAGRAGVVLAAPLPFVLVSTWAHALLMLYGLFIFFVYGFLFTAFPRWIGASEISRRRYLALALVSVVALVLIYAGLFTGRAVLALGLALHLAGWTGAIMALYAAYRAAPKRGVHERLVLVALGLGAIGLAGLLYGAISGRPGAYVAAREIGLWGFLTPLLLTVTHRMIPFFTQSALPFTVVPRPGWSVALFFGGSLLHGLFELLAFPAARLAVDVALAAVAWHHTVMWGLRRSLASRLLAMLHVSFLWFGIAMALYALQGALQLAGLDMLGRAPLHGLGIGFMTGTLVAMATRVTLGHSGRALAVTAPTWYLFLGIHGVALLRIAAELAPAAGFRALNLLAAAGWLACMIAWAAQYLPIYLRPRVDRRPG